MSNLGRQFSAQFVVEEVVLAVWAMVGQTAIHRETADSTREAAILAQLSQDQAMFMAGKLKAAISIDHPLEEQHKEDQRHRALRNHNLISLFQVGMHRRDWS